MLCDIIAIFHQFPHLQVLTVPQKKNNIQVAWKDFQATIPKLSLTMQSFVKNQDNVETKVYSTGRLIASSVKPIFRLKIPLMH